MRAPRTAEDAKEERRKLEMAARERDVMLAAIEYADIASGLSRRDPGEVLEEFKRAALRLNEPLP